MCIFPWFFDGFLARRRLWRHSWRLGALLCVLGPQGPPQGVLWGLSRSLRKPLGASGGLKGSFVKRNLTVKADGAAGGSGRLHETFGSCGGLREAPRGSVKRNLTVKADGSSRRLGGYGRLHEALRGSGGFHEAPRDSAIMNLTVKAYGSAGGSGRLQSGG